MKNNAVLFPLLSALLIPIAACGTTVLGGGGGDGGSGVNDKAPDSTTTSGTPGVTATGTGGIGTGTVTVTGAGGAESTAVSVSSSAGTGGGSVGAGAPGPGIAVLFKNLPPAPEPPNGLASFICQGGTDGALAIFWSNVAESCSEPFITATSSGESYQGILVLPPDALHVGTVDLSGDTVTSCTFQFDGNEGGGGGGPLSQGTIEIVAIDDTAITLNFVDPYAVSLAGSFNNVPFNAVTIQGTYTIPLCQ